MISLIPLLALFAVAAAATEAPLPPRTVLTLDQALAAARAQQPQVRAAAATTRAAGARADQAHAALLPQVSGVGTYQRATANFVNRPGSLPRQLSTAGGGESTETFGYYNFGVSASYLLYDFGQTRDRWRSAIASFDSQRDTEQATSSQVLYAVRTAFFQARAAKELVTVANDTLTNQRRHLQQTEGFVEVGTQSQIALAQGKTAVANAEVQRINAENGYETAKAMLNQAMGVEQSTDYDVADESPPPVTLEDAGPDVLLEEALKGRPEIAAVADQVRAQELTVKALRSAYYPSLGISSGVTDAGSGVTGINGFGGASGLTWNWSSALQISVPIFTGGLTKAQVAEGEANLAVSQSQLQLERLQVRLEVEQARLAVRAAKGTLAASGDALTNAQDQLSLAEGRYETGVGGIIELGDAQVALTSAAQQKVQAEYSLAQARAQLVKALGRD